MRERTQQLIARKLDQRMILPYVQRHEFESLLFADVRAFSSLPDAPEDLVASLQKIRSNFPTPEDINDSTHTAPSKRIHSLAPRYNKKAYGPLLAKGLGLNENRAECPRFDAWVTQLESLGRPGG